jgi:hypothetical protein
MRKALEGEKAVVEILLQTMLGTQTAPGTVASMLGLHINNTKPTGMALRPLSTENLQTLVEELYALAALTREGPVADMGRFTVLAVAMKLYPKARANLLAGGHKAEEVDALPVLQVVALDSLATYRRQRDEVFKWLSLPYWEAHAHLERAEQHSEEVRRQQECLPVFLDLQPAVQKVHFAGIRVERRIATLRAIEALRLHAAAHEGKLPNSWSEVKSVPLPIDPVTGKEFSLRVTGNKATLFGPPPAGHPAVAHNTVYYEITLEH